MLDTQIFIYGTYRCLKATCEIKNWEWEVSGNKYKYEQWTAKPWSVETFTSNNCGIHWIEYLVYN